MIIKLIFVYLSKDEAISLLRNANLSKKSGTCRVNFFIAYKKWLNKL